MVRGGLNFKVDYKMDIKRVHRGVTMEYFNWFSWLSRCLDKSDGPRMGCYDSELEEVRTSKWNSRWTLSRTTGGT